MNETLKRAIEIMETADSCFRQELPVLEVGEGCTISDVWDGEGNFPDGSYSYMITDSGEDGETNCEIFLNYEWEVVEEKENPLETEIRITRIELL